MATTKTKAKAKTKTTKAKAKTKTTAKKTTKKASGSKKTVVAKPINLTNLSEKDLIKIKENFMNSLDDNVLNIIATLMHESGLPVEALSEELFNVMMSIACRVAVDVGINSQQIVQVAEEYYFQAKAQYAQDFPEHYAEQQIVKKIDPKDLN